MWNYEKRLQHPVKITQTNPKMAQVIISQFGGRNCFRYYILNKKKLKISINYSFS